MATVTPGKTLYAQLGVSADADAATISSAYQSLLQLYQGEPASADSNQRLQSLTYAYELLSDPLRRQVYDASLAAGTASRLEQNPGDNHQPTPAAAVLLHADLPTSPPNHSRTRTAWRLAILALVLVLPGSCYYMVSQTQQKARQLAMEVQQVQREQVQLESYLQHAEDPELVSLREQLEQLQLQEQTLMQQARHASGQILQTQQQALTLLRAKRQLLAQIRQRLLQLGAPLDN